MPRGDKELLKSWREGDAVAGEQLFDRHYEAIARYFANKVGPAADDLIQNTFLGCVEGKERFREESSFRTYLFGIARNLLHQHYRVKRRDGARFDPTTMSSADLSPGTGTMIAKQEADLLLLAALRSLTVEQQELLEMYYWESQKAAEIAEFLDVPEGTVRTRLRAAKKLLAAKLAAQSESLERLTQTATGLEDWARELKSASKPN